MIATIMRCIDFLLNFCGHGRQFRPNAHASLVLVVALGACTEMPLKNGPRANLLPGIERPRDRNDMDITIHQVPVTAWPKCLEFIADKQPMLAVASVVTLSIVHACARVPRDKSLAKGERPWCIIAIPEGDETTLEHEIRHCEGWDHPLSTVERAPPVE